jgi:hypothetical protein
MWSRLGRLQALKNNLQGLLELRADVAEVCSVVRDVRNAVEGILAARVTPRPRWAQVLVLWQEPVRKMPALHIGPDDSITHPEPSYISQETAPCCLSLSFNLNDPQTASSGVRSDTVTRPIPAGAWLVASGCLVSQVFVGAELQDVGSGIQGLPLRYLRLRDPIGVGMYLRCGVVPDNGER